MGLTQRMCSRQHAHAMWVSFLLLPLLFSCSSAAWRHQQGLRAPPPSSGPPPDPLWFQQRLDHFRPSETRTWRQRYFLSKKHYKEGGPTLPGWELARGRNMPSKRELPWFSWSTDTTGSP